MLCLGALDAVQVEHMYRNDLHPLEWGSSFVNGVQEADDFAFCAEIAALYNRPECSIMVQFGDVIDHFGVRTVVETDGQVLLGYRRDSQNYYRLGPGTTLSKGSVAETNAPKAVLGAWSATGRVLAGVSLVGDAVLGSDLVAPHAAAATLRLGHNPTESAMPITWYDAVYVWPRRLTDAEILSVMTPYDA